MDGGEKSGTVESGVGEKNLIEVVAEMHNQERMTKKRYGEELAQFRSKLAQDERIRKQMVALEPQSRVPKDPNLNLDSFDAEGTEAHAQKMFGIPRFGIRSAKVAVTDAYLVDREQRETHVAARKAAKEAAKRAEREAQRARLVEEERIRRLAEEERRRQAQAILTSAAPSLQPSLDRAFSEARSSPSPPHPPHHNHRTLPPQAQG